MPLNSDESYVEVTRACLDHWGGTAELKFLMLPGGVDRADLEATGTELQALLDTLAELDREASLQAAHTQALKARVRDRLVQFSVAVRTWYEGRVEGRAVPQPEAAAAPPDQFCRPVRDTLRLWDVINDGAPPAGLPLPLLLPDRFSRDDLAALMEDYQTSRLIHEDTEFQQGLIRASRDQLRDWLRDTLVAYHREVIFRFRNVPFITGSLPRLFDGADGIPDPLELRASWDDYNGHAVLRWDESLTPGLKEYQIRWLAGPVYQRKGSKVVAGIPRDAPLECTTVEGLPESGATASYCLYAIPERGRARAGSPVTVTRP